ncbi:MULTISPECIES: SEL1-like repeat protein [unclassified Chryseobacterium]|uniref:SEL1-like repeat protein n=1 Tax=unclassified Chryseobacterium TaxID=2593645 RepID=UPI000F4507C2|nr:SEL1-like repeat protein [Chryseobacterium sp. G0240]ROI05533.1 hypothetical protein EGI16_03875 [Chryseobacterium sp. G0240]
MAHRIYVYNIDSETKERYTHYLGEWNYEIPELLLPLFSCNPRSKGKLLYFDKNDGVARLKSFYQLLGEHYQLLYKKVYYEPVNKMFDLLDALPYDTFEMDAWDVFNMNEEIHTVQAKDWVLEIQEKSKLYDRAMANQNLAWLEKEIFARRGYDSFLALLETDWIDYGLGYWNEELYKNPSDAFEENGLWGLKDKKGNVLIPAVYEEIFAFTDEGIAVAKREGKFGYLRNDGKVIVECIYEDTFDNLSIGDRNYGIISMDGKLGLIDITLGDIVIPCEYDELDLLWYNGLFNAKKEGKYRVIDVSGKQIISDDSETPFDHDYPDFIYRKQTGTSKRAYYTHGGIFLGEYPDNTIAQISNGFYWVKPNKFQKKISIINPDGSILDTDIDKIIMLDDWLSFAYKKGQRWLIFDTKNKVFRLNDHLIENVAVSNFNYLIKDVMIVSGQNGTGLYQVHEDHWLLPLSEDHRKIEICSHEIFRITTSEGMYYYDQKTAYVSPLYDYVCEGMDYQEELLCLFRKDEMFILDINRILQKIPDTRMGTLYRKRHHLRGKDQTCFIDFYNKWKEMIGSGYEAYFDNDTLKSRAVEYQNEGKIKDTIRLYRIGADRGDADMIMQLGYIFTDSDIPEFYDLQKGLDLYEKAAKKDQPYAWNNLGYHYQEGIGYPQDIKKALRCFRKAADLGNGLAMQNLGNLYFYGEHVLQDYDVALEYYKKAEKKLYPNSQNMSEIYYRKNDYANLLRYLKRDDEDTYSHIYYGILYDEGLGVKQSSKKAIIHYEKALEYLTYSHALERLLYFYKEDPAFADAEKYSYWKAYGEENNMEI